MKKLLSMALALCLCLSVASASLAEGFTPAESYDPGERVFDAGKVTLSPAAAGGGAIDTVPYAGVEGKDYSDEKVYTYNDYTGGIGESMNWDILSWETNEDDQIVSYITTGFYTFNVNEDKTGYSITPEMAADYPVDVTAEYAGKYGVAEGETGKAWRIALNPDACFEDGTKITADDYIYSMQQQLNPKMLNRRADSWYAGTFVIVNAKNYLFAGKTVYNPYNGEDPETTDLYVGMWSFFGLQGAKDEAGNECPEYVLRTDETKYQDPADGSWVSAKDIFDTYFADYAADVAFTAEQAANVTWEDVGLKKIDDYTIDFVLENPVSEPAFYVPYNLSGNFLVEKEMYEKCKSFFKDGAPVATEEEADEVTSNYCKTLETSVSYGPYKLSAFELDKEYTLSRNENWYGYKDGKHKGMYQTDNIKVSVIVEHATALLAFEKGEIDGISLANEDMAKYASSKYIKYTPESHTTKITFNTNYESLVNHGTGSQVLVVDEFRKAFAFALDANDFATKYTAAGQGGFGLLNYMYCYDPFTGALYRDSEYAKDALVKLFEMEYGEGKDYATLDEAYDAMTGYDMAKAQSLMAVAADKAIEAKIWDGETPITIDIRVYNTDTIYVQMFNYMDTQLKEAAKGSKFEGKLSMTMTTDGDYYNTMYSGGADIIFSTWGGATMDPFGNFASVYTDAADGTGNQMEYGYDTTKIIMNFDVEGVGVVSDTLRNWSMWANNDKAPAIEEKLGKFAKYSYDTRCQFAAKIEQCFMNWFPTTSLYYRNVASLNSQKVNDASDQYLTLVGFGGIQYITYNYDDAEWADYIANNTLVY